MIKEKNSLRRESLPAFAQDYLTDDMLLFDIETTGLSPARDTVYCIGCGRTEGDEAIVELFFAESPADEAEVLEAFFALTLTHPALITFNGTTFDLPFLKKRMSVLAGENADDANGGTDDADGSADECRGGADEGPGGAVIPGEGSHLDLYREARAMRGLLGLPSYKQKSIESFLGIGREDIYSGGELIEFYQKYVGDPDPEILEPILLHNREDVMGMFDLLGILAYRQFADGKFTVEDVVEETDGPGADGSGTPDVTDRYLSVKLRPEAALPQSIHRIAYASGTDPSESDGISFVLDRDAALIRFPIYHGELKHFFDDPENYYYLPEEDTAIHRSVGRFVDPSHRVRATRKNCYTKKECDYLALSPRSGKAGAYDSDPGSLKKDYDDREICLELPAGPDDMKAFVRQYFSAL